MSRERLETGPAHGNTTDSSSNYVLLVDELADGTKSTEKSAWWIAKSKSQWLGLTLSLVATYMGYIALGLLIKLYFVNGGSKQWLCSWLQTAGWPIPILATLFLFWKGGFKFTMPISSPKVLGAFTLLGCLVSAQNFLYVSGSSYLPASTTGILFSSQIAFNAVFSVLLTGHKLTAFSLNAVVLVLFSAVILALDSKNDTQLSPGATPIGYILSIAASVSLGLINPLAELVFGKLLMERSSALNQLLVIFEYQAYVSLIGSGIFTVAMVVRHDFGAMPEEAQTFKGGETAYYMTLFWTALFSQIASLGTVGVIYLGSALLAGIVVASLIPINAIFYAFYFHDSFGGFKTMAVIIAVWGSASYVYGSYLDSRKSKK